jgi:hypothetical protein
VREYLSLSRGLELSMFLVGSDTEDVRLFLVVDVFELKLK